MSVDETSKNLVGIGECMIELSQADDGLLRKSFAGDVLNSLWYAKLALGQNWNVQFLSAVGMDPMSTEMLHFIGSAGIDTATISRRTDRRPGLYMIHLDGAERSFSYWRDTSAARLLAADRKHFATVIDQASAVYLSGITLAILPEDDLDYVLETLKHARSVGKFIAFDSNIRPALWPDTDRMKRKIHRAASVANLVLPSFDDEVAAFGDELPHHTLQRYIECGAETVVLKNGADKVDVLHQGVTLSFPTIPTPSPVDTTGAGDSFNGAFLASFLQTGDIALAVQSGQTCAANVICHHGALVAANELAENWP